MAVLMAALAALLFLIGFIMWVRDRSPVRWWDWPSPGWPYSP